MLWMQDLVMACALDDASLSPVSSILLAAQSRGPNSPPRMTTASDTPPLLRIEAHAPRT